MHLNIEGIADDGLDAAGEDDALAALRDELGEQEAPAAEEVLDEPAEPEKPKRRGRGKDREETGGQDRSEG